MDRSSGKPTRWMKWVGHRVLAVEDCPLGTGSEVLVIEVSPKRRYVKFRFPSGAESWEEVKGWLLIEDLGLVEEAKSEEAQV